MHNKITILTLKKGKKKSLILKESLLDIKRLDIFSLSQLQGFLHRQLYFSLELESDQILVSLKGNLRLHNLFHGAIYSVILIGRL